MFLFTFLEIRIPQTNEVSSPKIIRNPKSVNLLIR